MSGQGRPRGRREKQGAATHWGASKASRAGGTRLSTVSLEGKEANWRGTPLGAGQEGKGGAETGGEGLARAFLYLRGHRELRWDPQVRWGHFHPERGMKISVQEPPQS